jgi:GNAT superfamily N-acetyltransferase
VAWILIEREESYEHAAAAAGASRATLKLHYQLLEHSSGISQYQGSFCACYQTYACSPGIVSLSAPALGHSFIVLDLPFKGHRIGTFLMNEIVKWVKQWPRAQVFPIRLLEGQADPDNLARRNSFYTQFGLEFDFSDASMVAGLSKDMTTAELTTVDTWMQNILVRDVADLLVELQADLAKQTRLAEMRGEEARRLSDKLTFAYGHPVRWLLQQWAAQPALTLLGLAATAFLATVLVRFWP